MTVSELIDLLSEYEPDSQVLVRFMNSDAYGSCWKDLEDFDKDNVIGNGNTVILDISDK